MKETIQKTREYLDYIERHYDNVQKAWKEIKEKCKHLEILKDENNVAFLDTEILQHDLSKLSEEEFTEYRKTFYPTSKERRAYLDKAWYHHKLFNPHHWENWTERKGSLAYLHCIHMIVDWTAMSYDLGGTAKEYYELNQHVINIPEEYVSFMYEVFDCL